MHDDALRLSVVIPCFDYARFLPRLCSSLAAQTLPSGEWEVVLADDGSTDGSAALARELLPGLSCSAWSVVELPHGGSPGRTRNAGIAASRGTCVVCLDPDDEPLPAFLASLLALLEAGADVVCCDYFEVEPGGTEQLVRLPWYDPELLRTQNILAPTAMFRRACFDRTRGWRENTAYEDWDLWIQMALQGCAFSRLPEPLFRHNWHGANFSHLAQARDGEAKAHIVRNNKRFFPKETALWADALLKREPWALSFGRGLIPRKVDVLAMYHQGRTNN